MNNSKRETLKKLAVEIYTETSNGNEVAKRLGVSHSTAYRLLHDAGVDLPDRHSSEVTGRRKILQGNSVEAAAKDYAEGMKMSDIQKKYNVGQYAIYSALERIGIPRRPHGAQTRWVTPDQAKEMVRLYVEEKLSQVQIGTLFNFSQVVVSRILREKGIEVRRGVGRKEGHGNWGGGKTISSGGYVSVVLDINDPMAIMRNRQGYVMEHRLVMARALGRPLTDNETVHHIDGDRENNLLSNLQLRIGKHGKGSSYRCADCGSYHIISVELDE